MAKGNGRPRVLILGGGFGGLYTALFLGKHLKGDRRAEVLLIDKKNYLDYTTFLGEVVSGVLDPCSVARPIRQMLAGLGLDFRRGEVQAVDLEARQVWVDGERLGYDYLVISLGSTNNYYGNDNFRKFSWPLKMTTDAMRLRNHIVNMVEEANLCQDPDERRALLTFVLVGAGKTGVEIVVGLRELLHYGLAAQFPNIAFDKEVRIVLVEALERILITLPPDLSEYATEQLKKEGIEVRFKTLVTDAGEGWVTLGDSERIETKTLVWTAGVMASPIVQTLPIEHDRIGRAKVDEYLNTPGYPNVYLIGDSACCLGEDDRPLGATAQVVLQQAPVAADNIYASLAGGEKRPFKYRHRGDLVAVGRRTGVADVFGYHLRGLPAWLMWKMVYLSKLPGMLNRIQVALAWLLEPVGRINTCSIDCGAASPGEPLGDRIVCEERAERILRG